MFTVPEPKVLCNLVEIENKWRGTKFIIVYKIIYVYHVLIDNQQHKKILLKICISENISGRRPGHRQSQKYIFYILATQTTPTTAENRTYLQNQE